MKIKANWAAAIRDEAARAKFVGEINQAGSVLNRLRDMILEMKKTPAEADYLSPSWAYQAADTNGFNRALDQVLGLLPKETD